MAQDDKLREYFPSGFLVLISQRVVTDQHGVQLITCQPVFDAERCTADYSLTSCFFIFTFLRCNCKLNIQANNMGKISLLILNKSLGIPVSMEFFC